MILTKETLIVTVLTVVVATNLYDLYVDISHGASRWHLFEEAFIVFLSTAAIVWLAFGLSRQQRELAQLKQEVQTGPRYPAVPDENVRAARSQLGKVMHEQFQQWSLTASEQEVALLLLKGLSFKEIAAVRSTLEKTVRQQASGIYRKAGVTGRHAFAAWFIEDFL